MLFLRTEGLWPGKEKVEITTRTWVSKGWEGFEKKRIASSWQSWRNVLPLVLSCKYYLTSRNVQKDVLIWSVGWFVYVRTVRLRYSQAVKAFIKRETGPGERGRS